MEEGANLCSVLIRMVIAVLHCMGSTCTVSETHRDLLSQPLSAPGLQNAVSLISHLYI